MLPGLPPQDNGIGNWFRGLLIPVMVVGALIEGGYAASLWSAEQSGEILSGGWLPAMLLSLIIYPVAGCATTGALAVWCHIDQRYREVFQSLNRAGVVIAFLFIWMVFIGVVINAINQ